MLDIILFKNRRKDKTKHSNYKQVQAYHLVILIIYNT